MHLRSAHWIVLLSVSRAVEEDVVDVAEQRIAWDAGEGIGVVAHLGRL